MTPETLKTKWRKLVYNFWPCYRGSGGRVVCISGDYRYIKVKLPHNWKTRNGVGTTYGGSMYGAVDPFYMDMLMKLLGEGYVVWDKDANIRFLKPARKTLYAEFMITKEELNDIKTELANKRSINRNFSVNLKDKAGKAYASVEKTIYIAKRRNR